MFPPLYGRKCNDSRAAICVLQRKICTAASDIFGHLCAATAIRRAFSSSKCISTVCLYFNSCNISLATFVTSQLDAPVLVKFFDSPSIRRTVRPTQVVPARHAAPGPAANLRLPPLGRSHHRLAPEPAHWPCRPSWPGRTPCPRAAVELALADYPSRTPPSTPCRGGCPTVLRTHRRLHGVLVAALPTSCVCSLLASDRAPSPWRAQVHTARTR